MLPRLVGMLAVSLTLCSLAASAQDLLSNGGFEEGQIDSSSVGTSSPGPGRGA